MRSRFQKRLEAGKAMFINWSTLSKNSQYGAFKYQYDYHVKVWRKWVDEADIYLYNKYGWDGISMSKEWNEVVKKEI